MNRTFPTIGSLATAALLSLAGGCTLMESNRVYFSGEEWDPDPADPFEIENRYIYDVNQAFDQVFFEPTARAYVTAAPEPVQSCVSNFFSNLGEPVRVVSHALVLNNEAAGQSLFRFALNTTAGGLGCFDSAGEAGVHVREGDLGLVARGLTGDDDQLYIVMPLLGPSSPVDAAGGLVGNAYLHPFNFPYGEGGDGEVHRSHLSRVNPYGLRERSVRDKAFMVQGVNVRAELLDATDLVGEIAIDEYSFVRDAYKEIRAAEAEELRQAD